MTLKYLNDISRRQFLAGSSAVGLSSLIYPSVSFSQDGSVVTIRSYSDIQILDPAFRLSAPEADLIRAIFAGLIVNIHSDTWDWKPIAAEKIEQLDPTTIAFTLRDNISFTDGFGQMTAEDVKFSIERIADPANESPYAGDWAPLKEVEVKDKLSGLIHLKENFAPLWTSTLPGSSGTIISKAAVESIGGKIEADPIAQSGQYLIHEWVPKQRTVLKRNPDWKYEPGGFEEIRIIPIEEPATAELGFEAGDLDFTWTAVSSIARYKENPPASGIITEKPSLAYVWLGINQDVPPFDNLNIRRAVQYAIDRETVVDAAYFGAASTSTGIIAPGLPGNRDANLYGYDPDKARELLAQEGVSNLNVTLDILNQSERLTAAQVIQSNLADVGINCEIKQNDSGTFWTLGSKDGDYWNQLQLILNRFSMEPDPSWATAWFIPEQIGVWNWERFDNKEFAELHTQGLVEIDPSKRDNLYKKMQDIMEESGCYVFLTHEVVGLLNRDTIVPATRPNGDPLFVDFAKA